MSTGIAFAYAQTRIQARHGRRPDAAFWRTLALAHGYPASLDTARRHPAWQVALSTLSDDADGHRIEAVLEEILELEIEETAGWLPRQWRALFLDLSELPQLAAAGWRAAGRELPATLAGRDGPPLTAAVRWTTGLSVLPTSLADRIGLWFRGWLERWPEPLETPDRDEVLQLLDEATRGRQHDDDVRNLRRSLLRLFRRHAGRPLAALAHLALSALALHRLRGWLLVRRLLPGEEPT